MWSSGIRVLLVEDDKELGDMIKRVLSVEGYEVEKDYDLLLLDLMLPRFDGIKIRKKVRESKEFPSVWTNIHTYRRFKATRRELRASALNTPLTYIKGQIELISEGFYKEEELKVVLQKLLQQINRMETLIKKLMLLMRLQPEVPLSHRTFYINQLFAELEEEYVSL